MANCVPKLVNDIKKQKLLQRQVLQHLKWNGPRSYDNLYLIFDLDRTAYIGQVLRDLAESHHIDIVPDRTVRITESGLRVLDSYQ